MFIAHCLEWLARWLDAFACLGWAHHMPVGWLRAHIGQPQLGHVGADLSFDHISDPGLVSPAESWAYYKQDIGQEQTSSSVHALSKLECIMFTQLPSSKNKSHGLAAVPKQVYTRKLHSKCMTQVRVQGVMNRSKSATYQHQITQPYFLVPFQALQKVKRYSALHFKCVLKKHFLKIWAMTTSWVIKLIQWIMISILIG